MKKRTDYSDLERTLIHEYNELMIGNQCSIETSYFRDKPASVCQSLALSLIQYAVENYLCWSPQKLRLSLSMKVLKEWHLKPYLKYIKFPPELSQYTDFFWIASLIYPKVIRITKNDVCIDVYSRIAEGTLGRYPKNFFMEPDGINKLCLCFKYAVENYTSFHSVEEAYEFFGTVRCLKFLRQYKLNTPLSALLDCSVTPLHLVLAESQRIEFLFQYYRLNLMLDENRRVKTETRGVKAKKLRDTASAKNDDKYIQPEFDV